VGLPDLGARRAGSPLLADPGFAELFRAEARVLASLDDPNVVRLYEYAESPGGGAAIVMELVEGVCLREILARHGQTTPEAALVVLQGSLLGLAAAHRRGVVRCQLPGRNGAGWPGDDIQEGLRRAVDGDRGRVRPAALPVQPDLDQV
jgi:hypothetical protein